MLVVFPQCKDRISLLRSNPMSTSVLNDRSWASSRMMTLYLSRSPSFKDSRSRTPSVMSSMNEISGFTRENREKNTFNFRFRRGAVFETNSVSDSCAQFTLSKSCNNNESMTYIEMTKQTSISSLTRFATDIAATRRGWVHPMRPCRQYPSSYKNWVSCVVFPEPVSPTTMTTTECFSI